MAGPTFPCGCPRAGDNVLTFKNGKIGLSTRCRACHTAYQTSRNSYGRRALNLVLSLHVEGVLSEGQLVKALGADRVEIRTMVDALQARAA